jgi:hypothetical protein
MRRRAFIELFIALLIFAGVLGAYAFWYVAVGDASVEAAALSKEIQAKGLESSRVSGAKDALALLADDEASMRGYLVRQEDIVPFLSMLEEKGSFLGSVLEVASVSEETSAGSGRGRILLALKITGSFDAVLRTLGAIEYGPYDSSVSNITLDTSAGEPGTAPAWTAVATFALGTRAR